MVKSSTLPISVPTLQLIMTQAPHSRLAQYLGPLNRAMKQYEINTAKRVAGFLAQLAVESGELGHLHERYTLQKDFQLRGVSRKPHTATSQRDYFEYWYGNRANLGNTHPGDGYTYRGRGAIQLTGRTAYRIVGLGIHKPLENHPELVETDRNVDMLAAAYFFARLKHCNQISDGVDPASTSSIESVNRQLTHRVNGGFNGLARRLRYFTTGLTVLKAKT